MVRNVPLQQIRASGECRELCQRGPGRALTEKGFGRLHFPLERTHARDDNKLFEVEGPGLFG